MRKSLELVPVNKTPLLLKRKLLLNRNSLLIPLARLLKSLSSLLPQKKRL